MVGSLAGHDAYLETLSASHSSLIIIHFRRKLSPLDAVFVELSQEYLSSRFFQAEGEDTELCNFLGISSFPTFVFVVNGWIFFVLIEFS